MVPEKKTFQGLEEFSNPYVDFYLNLFNFSARYNTALAEASCQAFETFLNAREEPAQKIHNIVRASFDAALQNRLITEDFAESISEYIDSWANLRKFLGVDKIQKYFANFAWYQNNVLEPIRDNNIYRTPSEEIKLGGRFNLLHYKSESSPVHKTPILLVYSLISRHYIFDLMPKVSVIRNLLHQGFDIYSTHWDTPTSYDKDLNAENYVGEYIEEAVNKIKQMTGSEKVSLLGYCWGGIFALIYSTIHPENVKSLILHSVPIDMEKGMTVVENWTSHLDIDNFVDKCGNVPGWFLSLAFILRNPIETVLKYPKFFSEPRSIAEIMQFFAIETWLYDSRPVIGEVYRDVVNGLYKKNLLIKNKLRVGPYLVNLKNITIPVLGIVGTKDDLVPPESSKPVFDAIGSTDKKIIEYPMGHVGLCISTQAHEKLWPEVGDWIAKH